MEQIAAEAGVSKPILYRQFADRAGLVAAVGRHSSGQVSEALERSLRVEGSARDLVRSTVATYLAFIEADSEVYRFLVHRTAMDVLDPHVILNDYLRQVGRLVAAVLGEALRRSGIDDRPTEPWAIGIVGLVQAAADWWLEGSGLTRTQLSEYLTSLIIDGLPFKHAADESQSASPTGRVSDLGGTEGGGVNVREL